MRLLLFVETVTLVAGGWSVLGASVVFEKDVKPILRKRCYGCHGPEQQMGSFRLDRRERAMVAGRGEPAIVPGFSVQSLMYRRISGNSMGPQMPLTGPLSAEEIATIKAWIDQGAKWPDEPTPQPAWQAEPRLDRLFEQFRQGNFSKLRAAVVADPALAKARNGKGATLLMQAAVYGRADDVRWLLAQGADPNVADAAGGTPLMLALEDAAKVRALLEGGANVNARSGDGQTAMLIALEEACGADVVKLLLEHGAKATPDDGTDPLVMAARNGDPETMKLLARARDGKYPAGALTGAAFMDCMACVELVLEQGVSKTLASNALQVAATTGRIAVLKMLLAAGADANVTDANGTSALMRAAYSDYAEVDRVKLLLEHGADINARDANADTALRIARRKGDTKVVALLVAAGAKE
ncbi:MAG: ankyrin repeat domain-containing protein [Acidobacteriia bacterium]|nr:ankyrin repeat domain-containing protein [Terriglobia bacterium]